MDAYLEKTCDPENDLLKRIHRETFLRETMPQMLSGHFQGRVLALLSKMIAPERILEIGTFTGYATLCLAEGLAPDGMLHTIDTNGERLERVRAYFDESPYADRIECHVGNALDVIPRLKGHFDLVFIDADKKSNRRYFEMLVDRVPSGGLLLLDNVLWKGKVLDAHPDSRTREVLALNETLAKDNRVEKLILPIRDGLFVLRKI